MNQGMHHLGILDLRLGIIQDSKYHKIKINNQLQNKSNFIQGFKNLVLNLTYVEKFSGIRISIIDSNSSSADSNIKSNTEVSWFKWHVRSILLDNHLSLEESTLWGSTIDLFRFGYHNWSVFKEIVYDQPPDLMIFQSWFYNALFEIAIKSKNLFKSNKNSINIYDSCELIRNNK